MTRRLARGGLGASFLWRWLTGLGRGPRPSSRVPAPLPLPAPGECSVTWVGHGTCVVRYAAARVITDPCFASSLYGLSRLRPAALGPGALEAIDVALLSHDHADHLHPRSLERLDRAVVLVVPAGTSRCDRLGFRRIIELDRWQSTDVAGLRIPAVPARHRVGWVGSRLAVGYVIEGDGPTVYFAGDTGYGPFFADIGARLRPELALLPIAGYLPGTLRRDHLSPLDALTAFEDLGAELLVPISHSAFPLSYEPPGEPISWLHSLASAQGALDQIAWLEPGQSCVARRPAP